MQTKEASTNRQCGHAVGWRLRFTEERKVYWELTGNSKKTTKNLIELL